MTQVQTVRPGCGRTRRWDVRALAWGIALAAGGFATSAARADDPLPAAEKILDKYVEVTGGKAAYGRFTNRITKATLEIGGQGLKLDVTLYQAAPNQMYSVLESKELGKTEKGTDGKVAWETSLMGGPQIKTGDERAVMLRGATFDAVVNWRGVYKKAECTGVEKVDEKPCYKVVLTPAEGEPETRYYDKDTNLLAKTVLLLKLPAGTVPIDSQVSDYKRVDGVLLPHKVKQVVAGVQQTTLVVDKIEHNAQIAKDRFDLPAEVKALADKPASKPAGAGEQKKKP